MPRNSAQLCVKRGGFFYTFLPPWGPSGYDRSGKCFRFDSNAGTAAVEWYLVRALQIEHKVLFQEGPGTSGHKLWSPRLATIALEWMGHAKALVHNQNGV